MSIRMRCTCGARLKVPDAMAGKSARCSACASIVLIPQKSTGAAVLANTGVQQWIRTSCKCGKVIKGPASWAGRIGNCPRCGSEITMPHPEPVEAGSAAGVDDSKAAAPPRKPPAPKPAGQPVPDDEGPDMVPGRSLKGSGLMDLTQREEVKIVDGTPASVWEGRRDRRAKNLAAGTATQIRYYRQSSVFEAITSFRFPWSSLVSKNPIVFLIVSVAVILFSAWGSHQQLTRRTDPPIPEWLEPPPKAYWYDIGTGEVFIASIGHPPPIRAPKQNNEAETPRGVRAHVFTCGKCTADEWFVAYIETFSATAQDAWERRMKARRVADVPSVFEDIPAVKLGRFVAAPDDKDFVSVRKPEADPILARALKPCPNGDQPKECEPPQ